jgi:ParB/RepB/Spo0J family partition protein
MSARMYCDPNDVEPNIWNPNVMFAAEDLTLLEDMREHGPSAINPISVSPSEVFYGTMEGHKKYVLVDGEHRWRHAIALKWPQISIDVQNLTEEQAQAQSYRKNKERGTIDPFKEAALFQREVAKNRSYRDIAGKYGVDKSTVTHRLSLLKLDEAVVLRTAELPRGTVTTSILETLATLHPDDQKAAMQEVEEDFKDRGHLTSARDMEEYAGRLKRQRDQDEKLAVAVKTAKFPRCPKCKAAPSRIDYQGLPWVNCSKSPWDSNHTWNLDMGKPKYESVYRSESLTKQKRPEISRVIRSNYTIKELTEAFFNVVRDALPQLESAEKIRVDGKIAGRKFSVDFYHYGQRNMSVSVEHAGEHISITAEEKAYHTGQKSKVDVSDWTPTKQDIDRHIEFIENAFKGLLLPIPEKKPKRIRGELPSTAEVIHNLHAIQQEVPCTDCSNNIDNGGDCHREHFHVDDKGAWVCERKKHLEAEAVS